MKLNDGYPPLQIDRVVADTLEMVQIPSATGNTLSIAADLKRRMEEVGLAVREYNLIENNPTLVARIGMNIPGKTLIFNGHMDVIPLAHAPAEVAEGRIYGRGACDMKGSFACILEAIRMVRQSGKKINGTIVLVANSLHEGPDGRGEDLTLLLRNGAVQADAAVVMEGAVRHCTVAQFGAATFSIVVERSGEPSHQLYTPEGTPHPIVAAAEIIAGLERCNDELKATWIPGAGYASYFIGQINSGSFYNQMPKTAVIEGIRRYRPDETIEGVADEMNTLLDAVRQATGATIRLDLQKVRDGYEIDKNEPIIAALQQAVQKERGIVLPLEVKKIITDAGIFVNECGIPTVCYGPDQRSAHAATEYVEIAELERTTRIYLHLIEEFLGYET